MRVFGVSSLRDFVMTLAAKGHFFRFTWLPLTPTLSRRERGKAESSIRRPITMVVRGYRIG